MGTQKKGPAEVGASPSRGSNNPYQENAVNRQHDSTAPQALAMPDMHDAFDALQEPVDLVRLRVNATIFVARLVLDRRPDENGRRFIDEEEAMALDCLTTDARHAADDAAKLWTSLHNAWCEAQDRRERAKHKGGSDDTVAPTVLEAIEGHRAAFCALGPVYEAESRSSTEATRAAVEAAETREAEAKSVLMRARPADLEEEAGRLEYLFGLGGPWHGFAPTCQDGADLVASLRSA